MPLSHDSLNALSAQVETSHLLCWINCRHTNLDNVSEMLDSFGAHIGGGEL